MEEKEPGFRLTFETSMGPVQADVEDEAAFQKVFAAVVPTARMMRDSLRGAAADNVNIEFGVKMIPQLGFVVSSGTSDSNFKVALSWTSKSDHK